ncbi:MAG: TatD family hydrolase [Spirochaetales bacterium]|nr:TatD family hydrolase [Spirochaetales bacterium]
MNGYKELVCGTQPVFDCHLHFQLSGWNGPQSLDGFHEASRFILNATGPEDWQKVIDICKDNAMLLPALGIHPGNVSAYGKKQELRAVLAESSVGHIGECGLDRFGDRPLYREQYALFEYQLDLAAELGLPVSVHCVRAWGDLLKLVKKYGPKVPAIMIHAFAGSAETMRELQKLNVYISFSLFTLRRDNAKIKDCLRNAARDLLLLDTDFPYREGQPMDEYPDMLGEMYTLAADICGLGPEKMVELIYANGTVFSSAASSGK